MGFGEWLRAELSRRGMTMTDLAKRTGVNQTTVSRWISGDRRPDSGSCERLAYALGISPNFVLELAGISNVRNADLERLENELASLQAEETILSERIEALQQHRSGVLRRIEEMNDELARRRAEQTIDHWKFAQEAAEIEGTISATELLVNELHLHPEVGYSDFERHLRDLLFDKLPENWSVEQKARFLDGLQVGRMMSHLHATESQTSPSCADAEDSSDEH